MLHGGTLGEMFTALAFTGAFVAMLSYLFAERAEGTDKVSWERMGNGAYGLHIFSIFGIIGTLFYLIYTHQYDVHYVWAHSSNELPVYYMISCFWEGQEGSFLLWCFWHAVLGGIVMRTTDRKWRNLVMAVIASVELILTSMILGIYAGVGSVYVIYLLLTALPAGYLLYRYWDRQIRQKNPLPFQGGFHLAGALLGGIMLMLILRGQVGFLESWSWSQSLSSVSAISFTLMLFAIVGYAVFYLIYVSRSFKLKDIKIGEAVAGIALLGGLIPLAFYDIDIWKIGSTPFIMLKSVFPDNPVYANNADFIPTNGTGLNSLLQNYWMVIHPPTLFLGFAATVIPFAFVIAGLIKGEYRDWIRPATPWMIFAVMILGVGIIMGGYWAYETLNFGGYWNWDPVENGSLVPWLCGIAGLHAMLIHQKTKSHLKLTMIMIMSTFLLVLYATFLSRSGVLGDTSVHTFTDLGLSGQLLVLLLVYVAGLVVLMTMKWKEIPSQPDESNVWSAEFFLFIGILIFIFSSVLILLTTSLPVFNKIFDTNLAPPTDAPLYYYLRNVWFAIGFCVFAGIGQFLWWRIAKKKKPSEAIFRPFVLAMGVGVVLMILMRYFRMEFVYNETFAEMIEPAAYGTGFFSKMMAYAWYGIFSIADELLFFSCLFVIFANLDVLFSLLKKNTKGLKVMGGTVAHLGFGLMLLGILYSSGYDYVVSTNINPDRLQGFPEEEKNDNVPLIKDQPEYIKGYKVTYIGKKQAKLPISNIKIIEEAEDQFKLRFDDADGDRYGYVLPRSVFLKKDKKDGETVHSTADIVSEKKDTEGEIDMVYVKDFLEKNMAELKPGHINNRSLFGVKFESLDDPEKKFVLYPEAEVNKQMGSIIAHPARKIKLDRDIYVHVSQIPGDEEQEPKYEFTDLVMQKGDTSYVGDDVTVVLKSFHDLSKQDEFKEHFSIVLAARLEVFKGNDVYVTDPVYLIGKDNHFSMREGSIEQLHMDFAFFKVDPEKGVFHFQVREHTNPAADWIVLKALGKPFINILWLGTFVLVFGFMIAIWRRIRENKGFKG